MKARINLNSAYAPSGDVVAREIEGELIIVPLVSGIGDIEDELFTLNETGKAIWRKLDGKKSLRSIANQLSLEFEASVEEIEQDVMGIGEELFKRKMIVGVSRP
jgi:hypothetical protein